ncbi:MAG: 5-(carboxyamino)imidazole ribonucleotide mutase, partial [Thermoleophilia bacterium]|nr:5-(carboxyamino)imidazole ribonucleotide mutase [Thermoleophilia bacterium]
MRPKTVGGEKAMTNGQVGGPVVGVLMGSQSDAEVMDAALKELADRG